MRAGKTMSPDERRFVVHITGSGRSGSTLLDRILGSLPSAASFGEIHAVWKHGFLADNQCACGARFSECEFWTEVVLRAFGGAGGIDPRRMQDLRERVHHSRHFLELYLDLPLPAFRARRRAYTERLHDLYASIFEVSGAPVLVDSSKLPGGPVLLSEMPGVGVHVVHLVRDVRAVVHSWQKKKYDPGTEELMDRHAPRAVVARWLARNAATELLARRMPYHRVRYEDFVGRPRATLQRLVDGIGAFGGARLPFSDERTIELGRFHAVAGNPQRFQTGAVTLEPRETWKGEMPALRRRMVTAMALPMLRRYGYL